MKTNITKIIFYSVFSLIFAFTSCNPDGEGEGGNIDSTGEVTGNENNNPVLEKMDYEAPTELTYGIDEESFLYDKFYPIGWSKDGFFAYVSEPADEATGFYFFKINIINTNTNAVAWTWEINEKNEIENGTLNGTWATNYDVFKKALNEYKIVMQKGISVSTFPFKSDAGNFDVVTKLSHTKDPFGYGFDVVAEVDLKIKSDKGNKEIFKINTKEEAYLNYQVIGLVKSPYQEQIAIFVRKELRGYEGPPNVILFETIGCNLTDGF